MKNFEDIEITDEQAEVIRESLTAWKEEMYVQLSEDVEAEKAAIREQLEKEADEYKASLKEDFTEKFINALEEMRKHVKAEVLAETIQTNPALQKH